jgi:hypothetical protein
MLSLARDAARVLRLHTFASRIAQLAATNGGGRVQPADARRAGADGQTDGRIDARLEGRPTANGEAEVRWAALGASPLPGGASSSAALSETRLACWRAALRHAVDLARGDLWRQSAGSPPPPRPQAGQSESLGRYVKPVC